MTLGRIGRTGRAMWGVLASAAVVGALLTVVPAERGQAGPTPILCGDATAPTCGGACPSGLRCVSLRSGFVKVEGTGPSPDTSAEPASQAGAAPAMGPDCECEEVLCGGVPLENGQSCCNGTPFTIGVQGCCRGVVVAANASCDCPGPIDLASQSCCGNGTLELSPVAVDQVVVRYVARTRGHRRRAGRRR